jgi:nucleoside-diphosphate-sugar epimerase
MTTYLVTGGAGFIGSHLAEALLRRGDRVRILDNFSTGTRANLAALSGAEVIEGDIRSYHIVREAVDGVHLVIHQAALPSVPRSVRDPITTNDVNVVGTLNVLTASRDARVARLVYASSSSVYGPAAMLPTPESATVHPISPYAVSKLAGENYCRAFAELYGFETVTLRYFNVFGPRQNPLSQYAGVIPLFTRRLLQGQPPQVFGDGTQTRDFTFVENVVRATLAACTAARVTGRVFNVAAGSPVSVLELLRILGEILSTSLRPDFHPARTGDVLHSHAAIDAAREALGYQPSVSFRDGLERTVATLRGEPPERA